MKRPERCAEVIHRALEPEGPSDLAGRGGEAREGVECVRGFQAEQPFGIGKLKGETGYIAFRNGLYHPNLNGVPAFLPQPSFMGCHA